MRCRICGRIQDPPSSRPRACSGCDALLRDRVAPLEARAPKRIRVSRTPGSLELRWRWFDWTALLWLPFAVFPGAMAVWAARDAMIQDNGGLWFLAGVFLLVALFLSPQPLAKLLNTTRIRCGADGLTVRHFPLPFRGAGHRAREDVQQLYGRIVIHTRKPKGAPRRETRRGFDLMLIDGRGAHHVLVPDLADPEEALWLEEAVEEALAIRDVPMKAGTAQHLLQHQRGKRGAALRISVAPPPRFRVEEDGATLRVRWAWRGAFSMVAFPALAMGTFAVITELMERQASLLHPVLVLLLPATYLAAVFCLNRTTVSVDVNGLEVRHGPLPWLRRGRTLARADLRGLEGRSVVGTWVNGAPVYRYEVFQSGAPGGLALIRGLRAPEEMIWLEAQLERRLGLSDNTSAARFVPSSGAETATS